MTMVNTKALMPSLEVMRPQEDTEVITDEEVMVMATVWAVDMEWVVETVDTVEMVDTVETVAITTHAHIKLFE